MADGCLLQLKRIGGKIMNLLTRKEVAERLRVGPRSVDRYIKSGLLRACKPGKHVLVDEQDLKEFVEASRVVGVPAGSPGSLR